MLLPLFVGVSCLHLFYFAALSDLSNFAIISLRKREMVAFLMSCDFMCSVGPTYSTVGLSAVCDFSADEVRFLK